jgi:ABC-type uncharacterized transport system permease subunit
VSLIVSGLLACAFYLAATILQTRRMLKGSDLVLAVKGCAAAAIAFHAVTNYRDFTGGSGIDLSLYPMLSLMALSIVTIVVLSSLRRPVDNLFVVIFPIAIVTLLLEVLLSSETAIGSHFSSGILSHILLSIVAYSLITIAAVQALLLSFGDSQLRHHRIALLRNMPPLQTMEHLMFEMLWAGLVFLTLSIASGFLFLEDITGPGLIHHTVITLAAWLVFSVLMWGRYQLGWRGAIASRWTLSGFLLLVVGYFGSKVVLEVILAP